MYVVLLGPSASVATLVFSSQTNLEANFQGGVFTAGPMLILLPTALVSVGCSNWPRQNLILLPSLVELNFQNELFNCTTCKALDTKEIENTFVLCLPHCVENLDTIITYSDNPNIKCDGIGIVTTVEIRMIILK